jgi:hypothetical protein
MIERHTRAGSLEMLSIGRDLVSLSSQNLIQTGFWISVISGIVIVLLRYGLRAPLWAWIKLGLSVAIFGEVGFALDPASTAVTGWARWSAEHGQLAAQFPDSIAQAGRVGIVVLVLYLATTIVAIWKPVWSPLRTRTEKTERLA